MTQNITTPTPSRFTVVSPASADYLTTAELGTYLGVSRSTVHRLLRKHKVRVIQLGRRMRVPTAEAERLEAELYKELS
ncbi:helix-turn-helix domain-containing protein [Rothia sp. ND6WE1A]|uniref:helix-turn-helix domain-containing protein n=1 Tax=Rothia sp. ND6WE1A TaxID=1848190 RepID=UPI0008332778|nr:helix-turn-helix domain-containing protein [Rothia sp. ND6WE1A]